MRLIYGPTVTNFGENFISNRISYLTTVEQNSGFSSEDTIFIQFFFTIGSIGLVCDKKQYQPNTK